MRRKIVALLLVLFVIGSYTGCAYYEEYLREMEESFPKAEAISFEYVEDKDDCIEFRGNIYYRSKVGFLANDIAATKDEYEYLGWTGYFHKTYIYANAKEDPVFLYLTNTREVFFREDYNYRTDEFVIEGTDAKFRFSEAFLNTDYGISKYTGNTKIIIASTSYPTLKVTMSVFYRNGQWYACSRYMETHTLSDDFVSILVKNRIIPHS